MTRHRQLGDIEFLVFEGAVEAFLRFEGREIDVASLYGYAPIEQSAAAIVIATSETQFEFRHTLNGSPRSARETDYSISTATILAQAAPTLSYKGFKRRSKWAS